MKPSWPQFQVVGPSLRPPVPADVAGEPAELRCRLLSDATSFDSKESPRCGDNAPLPPPPPPPPPAATVATSGDGDCGQQAAASGDGGKSTTSGDVLVLPKGIDHTVIIILVIAKMAVFNVAGYLIEERRRWPVIPRCPAALTTRPWRRLITHCD